MFILKKIFTSKSTETKEIEAVKTWIVSWTSRKGRYSTDVKTEFEAFVDMQIAKNFKLALENAFKLIRHTSENTVTITEN